MLTEKSVNAALTQVNKCYTLAFTQWGKNGQQGDVLDDLGHALERLEAVLEKVRK